MVNRSDGAPGTMSGRRRGVRRGLGLGVVGILAATLLSACGDEGKPTLNWYINPDGVDTFIARAAECSTDDYDIEIQMLPTSATDQRVQLARRLAAEDSSTDLMNLDPVFVPEFANAGWLAEVTDDNTEDDLASTIAESAEGEGEYLAGAADTVTWEDGVYAIPLWANTQVLWYRKSLAEAAGLDIGPDQPVTWEQVIQAAADNGGTVGVQANRYEAYVVWINALIQGAGGDIVSDTEAGTRRPGRHRLRRRPHRRRDHPDAGRLPGRAARPLGLQRGHQPGPDVPGGRAPGSSWSTGPSSTRTTRA